MDAAAAVLAAAGAAAGAAVIAAPHDSPWDRRAVVTDPDGHRVELLQAKPET